MKYFAKVRDYISRFIKKGLSPKEIALGVAVGTFVACVPVFGTHTIIAIFLASILRVNTLIVLLGTQISNPVSYPFQLFVSAQIGNLLLHGRLLRITFSGDISYFNHYIWPILAGSLFLGVVVSGLSYVVVKGFLKRKQRAA